jgi:hypothetical protein
MRAHHSTLYATALAALFTSTIAMSSTCPVTDEQFLKQLSTMKEWTTIYSVFKRNLPGCPDDGFYAEGYTEAVVVALAKRLADLGELDKLVTQDVKFRRFVYRHIDASADENDLRRVLRNTRTKCPTESARLCGQIAARARAAIAQVK